MPRWLLPLWLALVSFLPLPAAQVFQYTARVWHTDSGLPHNTVRAVLQTQDGYLWVGTQKGLARFDGVRFTVFVPESTPQIQSAFITALAESPDGTLWIGTQDGGLTAYKEGQFQLINWKSGLASDAVRCLLVSRDGTLWVGTTNGISRRINGAWSRLATENGLSHNAVRALHEDRAGTIWIAADQWLNRYRDGVIEVYPIPREIIYGAIRTICEDREGTVWVGANSGLFRLKEGEVTRYTVSDGLLDNFVGTLHEDRQGVLWVGSYSGLNRVVNGRLVSEVDSAWAYEVVHAVTEDQEGNLWVGTKDGLKRLNTRMFTSYTRQDGLGHHNATTVYEDREGRLVFGTWGGGLSLFKDGRIQRLRFPKEAIGPSLVLSMHQSRDGRLWVGTDYDAGLFEIHDGKINRHTKETWLKDPAVRTIHEGADGTLWLGTGSALYRVKAGRPERFTTADGLAGNTIRIVSRDRKNNVWVGTSEGLSRWHAGKFLSFTVEDGLPHNTVTSIYADEENTLWLGTIGGGICRYKDGHFVGLTTRQGLFSDDVFEILEDDLGFLWLSSNNGIFRVAKQNLNNVADGVEGKINNIAFGKGDGLLSLECNSVSKPSAWKARDGRLWFATAKGVVVVDPRNEVELNQKPPPVKIERVLADKHEIVLASEVRVPPGRGELEFHYTALSFKHPEKNRFRYQLEGVDSDWVEAETRRVALYNNLQPGTYRFKVIASNSDSFWNETGAALAIVVMPHYWQTWWFKLAISSAFAAVLGILYHLRLARLQEIERLRLRIAADLHDEVGSNLGSISLLSCKVQSEGSLSGEQERDLESIHRITTQTAHAIRDIVWFIHPEYDTLQDLLMRMKDAAGALLVSMDYHWSGPQEDLSRKLPVDFRQNMFLMYKEILTNIAKHSRATEARIRLSLDNGLWVLEVQDNGRGFDAAASHQGNGLKNLRRRAEKLRGRLDIASMPGKGTTIRFETRHL